MKNLVEKTENGVLVTDSLKLAGLFGRSHKGVLRTIRNIVKDFDDNEISRRNFAPSEYINERGKRLPFYVFGEELALIITGRLTGKDALVAQLKLADEFIAMRDYIQQMSQSDAEMLRLTRISPNTLKAITGNRSNNEVRKGYIGLTKGGYLVDAGKWVWKHNYQLTEKGLECVKAVKHGILHFKPEYHEALMDTVANYTEQLTSNNHDLFIDNCHEPIKKT